MKAVKENKAKGNGDKPKARRLDMSQLVVLSAYAKTFTSGKAGFFGKVQDIRTGKRYQITAAVEIAG